MKKDYTKNKAKNQYTFCILEDERHKRAIDKSIPAEERDRGGHITKRESFYAGLLLRQDSKTLKGHGKLDALIMYYDMALNQDGQPLPLSRAHFEACYGMGKNQYIAARKKLIDAGYLTPDPADKEGFLFWRVPERYKNLDFVEGETVDDPEDEEDATPEDLPEEETAAPAIDQGVIWEAIKKYNDKKEYLYRTFEEYRGYIDLKIKALKADCEGIVQSGGLIGFYAEMSNRLETLRVELERQREKDHDGCLPF